MTIESQSKKLAITGTALTFASYLLFVGEPVPFWLILPMGTVGVLAAMIGLLDWEHEVREK